MAVERTFAMIKPGVLQRRLAGRIITRLENKGFLICALKMIRMKDSAAEELYREHKGRDFYEPLMKYTKSDPVIVMVLERDDAVATLRRLIGPTDTTAAQPGTIRGDFGVSTRKNLIHASDSPESAAREMSIFFTEEEIQGYNDSLKEWF